MIQESSNLECKYWKSSFEFCNLPFPDPLKNENENSYHSKNYLVIVGTVVVLLVILALIVLLWFGNQQIFQDFKSILIAVGAIASILVRFGGMQGCDSS